MCACTTHIKQPLCIKRSNQTTLSQYVLFITQCYMQLASPSFCLCRYICFVVYSSYKRLKQSDPKCLLVFCMSGTFKPPAVAFLLTLFANSYHSLQQNLVVYRSSFKRLKQSCIKCVFAFCIRGVFMTLPVFHVKILCEIMPEFVNIHILFWFPFPLTIPLLCLKIV